MSDQPRPDDPDAAPTAVDEPAAPAAPPAAGIDAAEQPESAPVEAPAPPEAVAASESLEGSPSLAQPAVEGEAAIASVDPVASAEEPIAPATEAAADGVVTEEAPVEEEASDDDDEEEEIVVAPAGPIEELTDEELAEDIDLNWYILKVQSNRERTSSEALKRKVAIEGLDNLFGEIIVPTEKVTEFKNGKKKTVERKIWPGYIAVQMHVNDDTWFAIRETSGIGDFTGASGKPIPMSPEDVEKILPKEVGEEAEDDTPKLNIKFAEGDKVKVTDGNFENFEGDVDTIDQQSGKITVMISIFGRSTPVELEYWQVEKL